MTTAARTTERAPLASDVNYAAVEMLAINAGHYVRFTLEKPVLHLYKFYYSVYWQWIAWFADTTLLLLPCLERPAYFTHAPPWVALIIEIIVLLVVLVSFLITMDFQNKKQLLREAVYPYIFATVFLLTIIDMIIYYSLTLNGIYYVRWTRPLRVIFTFTLQTGQKVRRIVRNILRTLPNIANVMFLFLLSVMIFTLLGVGILRNKKLTYPNNDEYFTNFIDTAWDLYVLTTTANNPDVMMPAFNESILYVIFFGAYLLINLYLFMNLLLAVIFSNYKQQLQEEQQLIRQRQLDTLMMIFERLTATSSTQRISYATYQLLMHAIKADMPDNLIEVFWKTLDVPNREDGLDIKQFNELLFNLNFDIRQQNTDQTTIQKTCPSIYNSKLSRMTIDFVSTGLFRAIINFLIICNAICLAVSYNDLEWFFLFVFFLEAILKMYAFGVREYFHHRWNLFDITIVLVSTTYSLLAAFVKPLTLNRDILDAVLVVRVLRLVKLVGNIDRFKVVFGTFSKVLPTLITYLRVMFMTYYIFAMIGMEIFQYKIAYFHLNSTMTSMCNNTRLNGSEFARSEYCRNNFNDYFSSLILLFELTVVNQWHILASGFVLVTSKWARLFFLVFHLTAVIVVLNIFTAFIIDSFLSQYILSQSKEFPWTHQEELITKRLTDKGYRIFRRYHDTEKSEENSGNKPFSLSASVRGTLKPSAYRQMALMLQNLADVEHTFLIRWSGNTDIDPHALLNLTTTTT